MQFQRFHLRLKGTDWQVRAEDRTFEGLIEHLLTARLRVLDVPPELPLVGHGPVGGRWCVFARESGAGSIEGVILDSEDYGRSGFDPFLVGARLLGLETLGALVEDPRVSPASGSIAPGLLAASTPDYLRPAYSAFLGADPGQRRLPYVSVASPELDPSTCPLCRFVTIGAADGSLMEHAGADRRTTPLSTVAPEAARPEPEARAWSDMELSREGEIDLEQVPLEPAPAAAPDADADAQRSRDELRVRLSLLESRVRSRTRLLWVAVALAVVLPAAVGFVTVRALGARLDRLAAAKLDVATAAAGLGVADTQGPVEDAVVAALGDLASVSVQSGAWQEGLRNRGVAPEEFLDHLVTLASVQGKLVQVARAAGNLTPLAGHAGALERIAVREADLARLSEQVGPLAQLAAVGDPLVELAAEHEAVAQLVDRAPDLAALAAARSDLTALAGRRDALEEQLRHAASLAAVLPEMTSVLTFMAQRRDDLDQLARWKSALVTLATNQQVLSDLAASSPALVPLAEEHERLLALAQDIHLRRMVDQDKPMAQITANLGALGRLATHADLVLAEAGVPAAGP